MFCLPRASVHSFLLPAWRVNLEEKYQSMKMRNGGNLHELMGGHSPLLNLPCQCGKNCFLQTGSTLSEINFEIIVGGFSRLTL